MKKPWEHTWHVDESGTIIRDERDYRIAETIELDVPPQEQGNARLASAAPELVRLALDYEWRVNVDGQTPEGGCSSCRESRLNGHADDCQLVAVLNKAGVPRGEFDIQPPKVSTPKRQPTGKQVIARLEQRIATLEDENARLRKRRESLLGGLLRAKCPGSHCKGKNEAAEKHTCPYQEEINDDHETLCECCDECQQECFWDI